MFRIEKKFTFPMGHRLSKHRGRCFSLHGHNVTVLVGVKAEKLNKDDMIIDFSDLKSLVNRFLDELDHCLLLNETDAELGKQLKDMGMRVITTQHDPTAERLSQDIYNSIDDALKKMCPGVLMEYVTVYENENSKATYTETDPVIPMIVA